MSETFRPTPYSDKLQEIIKRLTDILQRGNGLFDTEIETDTRKPNDRDLLNHISVALNDMKEATVFLHTLLKEYHE